MQVEIPDSSRLALAVLIDYEFVKQAPA